MKRSPAGPTYGRLIQRAYEYWLGRGFRKQRQRIDGTLRELARRYHGQLTSDTDGDVFPMVVVKKPQALLQLKVQPSYQDRDDFNTLLTVRSRAHDGKENPFPVLHCLSSDMVERDYGAPWMKPLTSGAETFDSRFLCREIPGGGAAGLLTPKLRQQLLNVYFGGARAGAPNLWFESQSNFVRFKQAVTAPGIETDMLRRLLTRGYAVFLLVEGRVLRHVQPLPGKVLVRRREVATCRVCGEIVLSRAVSCASCETVHHDECWRFNGRCALYACGSEVFREMLEWGGA